jgi:hypothetical protein
MERVTMSIDSQTLEKIRHVAGPRGVSAFVHKACEEKLARNELLALLDELDAKYGPPTLGMMRAIDADARRIFEFPPPRAARRKRR